MKIVILGAGSVGSNLHHGLSLNGIRAELVHARPLTAEGAPAKAEVPEADVYIYAIADHALREVVARVDAPKALHLHTSGSMICRNVDAEVSQTIRIDDRRIRFADIRSIEADTDIFEREWDEYC